jgi:hypothetical protein
LKPGAVIVAVCCPHIIRGNSIKPISFADVFLTVFPITVSTTAAGIGRLTALVITLIFYRLTKFIALFEDDYNLNSIL